MEDYLKRYYYNYFMNKAKSKEKETNRKQKKYKKKFIKFLKLIKGLNNASDFQEVMNANLKDLNEEVNQSLTMDKKQEIF